MDGAIRRTGPTGPDALAWLRAAADERARAGVTHELVDRPPGADRLIDLASNDYLGLSRHPMVIAAATSAAQEYGAGATGSRLVTGSTELHRALEEALAGFCKRPTGLVLSSGYLANLAAVTALAGPDSLVVSSASNHASLVDACRLSQARVVVVPDDDVDAVRRALKGRTEKRAVMVTDAVCSVTGHVAPLAELHAAARDGGAALIVDEAHALGVVGNSGQGACAAAGLAGEPDIVQTVSLAKGLGSQGGAILGTEALRDHLIDTARAFIFDTALAPSCAGAALAALELVSPRRVTAVRATALQLSVLLDLQLSQSALLSIPVGDPAAAVAARDACAAAGVRVGCLRPPSVPPNQSCLRVTARADLDRAEATRGANAIRAALSATGSR